MLGYWFMKKILGIIVLGLLLSGNAYSETLKFQCGKFQVDIKNLSLINNGNGKKIFKIDNEVKWYMVTNLQGIPIVVTNTLNIENLEWTRKAAGERIKKRSFKKLTKKLTKKNKKINNYQKKQMLDQELFVVSNFGTIEQEFEKFQLIEGVINAVSDSKQWDKKCLHL